MSERRLYRKENGRFHLTPLLVDEIHVVVMCPYCNNLHSHGSCGGKNYAGPRSPHCHAIEDDYFIDNLEEDSKMSNEQKLCELLREFTDKMDHAENVKDIEFWRGRIKGVEESAETLGLNIYNF